MDMKFKSKVGGWYYVLILIVLVIGTLGVINQRMIVGVIALAALLLMLHVLFTTFYVVTAEGVLQAHCSFFPRKELPVAEIDALERSLIPVFSYSLSLNRIIIWNDKAVWMLISPENEKEFIRLLRSFNPDILLVKDNEPAAVI
jgi:hypothetical protein